MSDETLKFVSIGRVGLKYLPTLPKPSRQPCSALAGQSIGYVWGMNCERSVQLQSPPSLVYGPSTNASIFVVNVINSSTIFRPTIGARINRTMTFVSRPPIPISFSQFSMANC